MKIQSIQFNYRYNTGKANKNNAFGHKSSYSYLKNLQGNRCACCGKEMILSKDIAAVWSKITRPLTVLLQEGRFNFAETVFPPIYKTLISFANRYPDESFDSIVYNQDNHFKFMNSVAKSFEGDDEYNKLPFPLQERAIKNRNMEMLRISSAVMKDSAEVMQNLKPLEHYLYGYRKDLFQELAFLSEKYPDKKLYEIIKYPEVAEKYIENTYLEAINFAKIRDKHWNKANKIILDKNSELEIPLNKLNKEICLIYRGVIDPQRVSYKMREAYKNFLKEYGLEDCSEAVLAEISQLPTELFSKNSFLSFARRYYNDGEIISYVIKPFMESMEHIDTVENGGTNAASNIIMMCRKCNEDRRNYPYKEHLAIHPEMIENAEKQIKFYENKILSGKIPPFLKNYPIEVARNLNRCSGGLMNYDVSDYIKALEQKTRKTNP